MKDTQTYTFDSYYKYSFTVKGEDGILYTLDSESSNVNDIYRFEILDKGEMKLINGKWTIDGLVFEGSVY